MAAETAQRVAVRSLAEFAAAGLGILVFFAGLVFSWASQVLPAAADFSTPLAGDYELIRSSGSQIHVSPSDGWSPSTPRIPPIVVELEVVGRHVLAAQRPSRTEPAQYWILDTATPSVTGPLRRPEFRSRAQRLAPGPLLSLRPTHEFRRWHDEPAVVPSAYVLTGLLLFGGALGSRLARSSSEAAPRVASADLSSRPEN